MGKRNAIAITEFASRYPHMNWCGLNPESTSEQVEDFFDNISDDKWLDMFLKANDMTDLQKHDWDVCVRIAWSLL